ncbi:hypothetical protein CW304_26290 [Bacillus sp. UFRGS-B20]|nr:hypothetical protein CW304_26290 [Bacillus sp. UFRGS-B20]
MMEQLYAEKPWMIVHFYSNKNNIHEKQVMQVHLLMLILIPYFFGTVPTSKYFFLCTRLDIMQIANKDTEILYLLRTKIWLGQNRIGELYLSNGWRNTHDII